MNHTPRIRQQKKKSNSWIYTLATTAALLATMVIIWTITTSILPSSITVADAAWDVNVVPFSRSSLEVALSTNGNAALVRITMVHNEVRFLDSMANDRSIFPSACVSSSNNSYGWNKYRDRLFDSVYVDGRTIQLRLQAVAGFSPTETETVTCSVAIAGSEGTNYIQSGALSASDATVSFRITSETSKISAVLETITHGTVDGDAGQAIGVTSSKFPLTEVIIRDYGFTLNLVIYGDVWDATKKAALINGLSCVSAVAAGCTWFNSIKNNASYVYLNDTAPHMVSIHVPRSQTRMLNLQANLTIEWNLPSIGTVRYGLKSSPLLSLFASDNKFTLPVATRIPELSQRTTRMVGGVLTPASTSTTGPITLTEDCIRGVNITDACPRALWIVVDPTVSQDMEFSTSTNTLRDLNETSLRSTLLGDRYLNIITRYDFVRSVVGSASRAIQASISLAPLYSYDIAVNDKLTLAVPYSMYIFKEMASSALTINVIPSSGEVDTARTTVRSFPQKDLWIGGFTFRIAIGGETFKSSIPAEMPLRHNSGSIGTSSGWEMFRTCVLPDGKVRFEDDTHNAILLEFTACSSYIQSAATETVTIFFDPSALTTGRPLLGQSPSLVFTITKSPGMFVLQGGNATTFLEEELQGGNVSLLFSLQGGEALIASGTSQWAACELALVSVWTSDVTIDPNAWISLPTRESLFAGAIVRKSNTELRINFNTSALYDTRKGESISINKLPRECIVTNTDIFGFKAYSMTILPRQGEARVGYKYPSEPVVYDSQISESMMRRGGFKLVIELVNDEFDSKTLSTLPSTVIAALTTTSLEPNGFLLLKNQLINAAGVTTSSDFKQIFIDVARVIKFDVRNNETVEVDVTGVWTASGRNPTNYGQTHFNIYKSAGDIILSDWFGANQTITENNIRSGDVWFKFGLLGDQWRAERTPYIEAFKSTDTSSTAFTALRDTIIPSIEFFEFESTSIYEYLTLRFQPNGDYDIFRDESISIEFPAETVVGNLAPFFSGAGVVMGVKSFTISVTRGTIILSGATRLNEKKIRQGGIEMYLTLFGEKWSSGTDSALCVRNNMHLSTPATDLQFNESILPYSSSGTTQSDIVKLKNNLIQIPLRRFRLYDIGYGFTDVLTVNVPGLCVESGLQPLYRPMLVPIQPTEGELRISATDPSIVYESDLRIYTIKIVLQLDGDTWNQDLRNNPAALVAGFASTSSSVSEPNGFFAARATLLNLGIGLIPDVRLTETTLEVSFKPDPTYNINNHETITFSIADPTFVTSGRLPRPSTVSFVVSITVKTIILIVDDRFPGSIKDGRYDILRLRSLIAYMLSCTLDRVGAFINNTRTDNLLVIPLNFEGSPTILDTRGNTELEEYFMNTKQAYLEATMGIRQVYYSDAPPADSAIGDSGGSGDSAAGSAANDDSTFETAMWVGGSILFAIILVGGYTYVMFVKQAKLGGAVRMGNSATKSRDGMYEVVSAEEAAEDDIDSPLGDAGYYDTSATYTHSTKLFQNRATTGQRAAKARVDSYGEGYTDKPTNLHEYVKHRRLQKDPDASKFDTMIEDARHRLIDDDDEETRLEKRREEARRTRHVSRAQTLLDNRREREAREAAEEVSIASVNRKSWKTAAPPAALSREDESRLRFRRKIDRMMDFYD